MDALRETQKRALRKQDEERDGCDKALEPGARACATLGSSLSLAGTGAAPTSQAGLRVRRAARRDTHLQADEGEGDAVPVEVPQEVLEPQHHGVVDAGDVGTVQHRAARGRHCGNSGQRVSARGHRGAVTGRVGAGSAGAETTEGGRPGTEQQFPLEDRPLPLSTDSGKQGCSLGTNIR